MLSGALPTREHARLVLRAGFAGEPVRRAGALLYDAAAVRDLADRPPVMHEEAVEVCPQGLYVARLPRERRLDVGAAWSERAALVAAQPAMPVMTAALVSVRIRVAVGALPWVATLCGYVVLCAEARAMRQLPDGRVVFDLVEPGKWASRFAGRQIPTRPGRPWTLLTPRPVSARHSGRALEEVSARGGQRSRSTVNGPWLTEETAMCAPKTPRSTTAPRADRARQKES